MDTLHNLDKGLRAVVPTGLIDTFNRDPGFLNDRPADCLNMWEAPNMDIPAYMQSGYISNTPGVTAFMDAGQLYIGSGQHYIYVDVTNSSSALGDQNYWILRAMVEEPGIATARNIQLEVSQRNSFVVWYPPGSSSPTIYASGAGMAYDATERWYFKCTPGASNVSFVVQKSALDGSGLTTIMTGNTGSDNPAGEFIAINSFPGVKYLQVGRLCETSYSACNTVTDAFNRSDFGDGTLGFADTGQRWSNLISNPATNAGNTWTIQGTNPNKAQMVVPTLDHYRVMRAMIDTGGNNQDVNYTFSTADDDYNGCMVRCASDGNSGYEIVTSAYGTNTIDKYVNGVYVGTLASWGAISLNTTHTFRAIVKDNNLKVYLDSVLKANITINPDDSNGNCETNWTYFRMQQNHGGSGGSAPRQLIAYTNTWHDDLSIVAP